MEKENNRTTTMYEKPQIITYTEDEITEMIGPARTCTSGFGNDYGEWHHRNR